MDHADLCTPREHRTSRRRWLAGTAGAAAWTLGLGRPGWPAVVADLEQAQKQVLFIWLDGGISQLESWDPKPGTQFGGPFRAIDSSVPGIQVSELLPRTAQMMHHLVVVRSLCTKDNSHSAGVARIQRGDPKNRGVMYPFLGSAVARLLGPGRSGLPPYISIKPGNGGFITQEAGFLGPQFGAVAFGDGKLPENLALHGSVDEPENVERNALRERADRRFAHRRRADWVEANRHVFHMAEQLRKKARLFDDSASPARDVERYGRHQFGRHMLLARRMIEAGVTFVKVTSYGWDTHGDNFNGHANMVPRFDQSFAAIIEDLHASGLLDRVLVIAVSEFGRTPRINGHVGRDHWPEAWSLAMAGCGLKQGVAVGQTNAQGTYVTTEELDIGHMFHTWFRALGVAPGTEYDHDGQPLPIANEACHPVGEVLA